MHNHTSKIGKKITTETPINVKGSVEFHTTPLEKT